MYNPCPIHIINVLHMISHWNCSYYNKTWLYTCNEHATKLETRTLCWQEQSICLLNLTHYYLSKHQQEASLGKILGIMAWWHHQMETLSALLTLCMGNSPVLVNSPHKGQWCWALMFSLICASINDWVNNCQAGDLRRHCGHYDVNIMVVHHNLTTV